MTDVTATLAAWRAGGAHRIDPVRFRFMEAMVRRAAAHGGEARRLLDQRLAMLVAAYAQAIERKKVDATSEDSVAEVPRRDGFADLLAHIAHHAPAAPAAESAATPRAAPAPELKAVSYFKSTWSRLSADRRLVQSLAKVPGNAGPLNSHHLVHRALVLMHELSPDYLNRFMSHVDALLWLEQMQGGGGAPAAADMGGAARADAPPKKRTRSQAPSPARARGSPT